MDTSHHISIHPHMYRDQSHITSPGRHWPPEGSEWLLQLVPHEAALGRLLLSAFLYVPVGLDDPLPLLLHDALASEGQGGSFAGRSHMAGSQESRQQELPWTSLQKWKESR